MKECNACGLVWNAKKEHPRACPKCKSYYWDGLKLPQGVNSPGADAAVQPRVDIPAVLQLGPGDVDGVEETIVVDKGDLAKSPESGGNNEFS